MLWSLRVVWVPNVYMSPLSRLPVSCLMPTSCHTPFVKSYYFRLFAHSHFCENRHSHFCEWQDNGQKTEDKGRFAHERQIVWYNVSTLRKVYAHDTEA